MRRSAFLCLGGFTPSLKSFGMTDVPCKGRLHSRIAPATAAISIAARLLVLVRRFLTRILCMLSALACPKFRHIFSAAGTLFFAIRRMTRKYACSAG